MRKMFKTPLLVRWIYARRVWGFSNSDKVFLTFDDGPTSELTNWILDFLKEEDVKATFFCVGQNVQDHPDIYTRILTEGHAIGNHTMQHERSGKVSSSEFLQSIDKASKLIDSKLFRPPHGRLSLLRGRKVRRDYKIIMWSWLSYDFDKEVSIEKILKEAERIKKGDILVLHDNAKVIERVKVLLPQLVRDLKEKGLEFDVISS